MFSKNYANKSDQCFNYKYRFILKAAILHTMGIFMGNGLYEPLAYGAWGCGSIRLAVAVSCNSVHGYVCIGDCMVRSDIGGFCCPRDGNVEAALCRVLALTASPIAKSKVKLKTVVVCYVFIAWL